MQKNCFEAPSSVKNLLSAYCIFISVFYVILNHQILNVDFLQTDDHEIFSIASNPFQSWMNSEAFHPWSRWRPIYYTIRSLEALLWGTDSSLWHLARLVGLAIALALLSACIMNLLGPRTGVLCSSSLLLLPILPSLTYKLGPAETYCLIGFSIWLFGSIGLLQKILPQSHPSNPKKAFIISGSQTFFSICIFIGTLLAAGSKENFAILLLPNSFLLYFSLKWNVEILTQTSKISKFFLALACSVLIPIWIFLFRLFVVSGVDVYEKSVRSSPGNIFYYMHTSLMLSGIVICFISVVTIFFASKSKSKIVALLLVFLLLLTFWSILFNRESIPFISNHRYALLHQLSLIVIGWTCVSYWTEDFLFLNGAFKSLSWIIGLPLIITYSCLNHANFMLEQTKLILDSKRWSAYLASTSNASHSDNLPILLISTHWLYGYESTDSASTFLRQKHQIPSDKIYFTYLPDTLSLSRVKDDFQRKLERSLSFRRNYTDKTKLINFNRNIESKKALPTEPVKSQKFICSVPLLTMLDPSVIKEICRRIIIYSQ